MAAPFGNALTSIVARAGYGLLKCAAIISFTTPNSFKSVRKIVSFTISFSDPPAASATALKFLKPARTVH